MRAIVWWACVVLSLSAGAGGRIGVPNVVSVGGRIGVRLRVGACFWAGKSMAGACQKKRYLF